MRRHLIRLSSIVVGFFVAFLVANPSFAQAPCTRDAHVIAAGLPDVQWVRESSSAVIMRHSGGEVSIQCEFTKVETEVRAVAVHWSRDSRQPLDAFIKLAVAMGSQLTRDAEGQLFALAKRCLSRARHPEQLGRYQAVANATTLPCRNDGATAALTFYKRLPSDHEN